MPLALACLAVGAGGAVAWPFTVDDAFILFDYAETLGQSRGYGRYAGEWTDGVTSPLWVMLLALGAAVGVGVPSLAKALGLSCMVAAVLMFGRRLRLRAQGAATGVAFMLLIIPQSFLGIWGVAGLETGLSALLMAIACVSIDYRPEPRPVLLGLAIGGLAWLRPECALFGVALLVGLSVMRGRACIPAWLVAGAGALSVLVWRYTVFGDALPLSWYAKPGDLAIGLEYTSRTLFLLTSGIGILLVIRTAWCGGWRERTLAGALAAHALGVTLAGGDWMPGARLFVPMLPLYAYLGALSWRGTRWRRVAVLGVLAASIVPSALMAVELPKARASAWIRGRVAAPLATRLGQRYERVALVDVGFLPRHGGFRPIDLGAITDREWAHLPGEHLNKEITSAHLRRRDPDAIVLHSATRPQVDDEGRLLRLAGYPVERRIAAFSWVRRDFRCVEVVQYHPGYFYAVLERRSLD